MQMNLLITTEMVAEESWAAVPRTPSLRPVGSSLSSGAAWDFPQKTSVYRLGDQLHVFQKR